MTRPTARAFLALWNSISSAPLQPEYDTWHSVEHVPERVGLPGFIEARRYRTHADPAGQPPRYFTCYWLSSLQALSTPEYRELVAHPTPWSARMRTELREFVRLPCTLSGACGQSTASQLATVHLRSDAALFAAQADARIAHLVHQAAILCGHWGTAEVAEDFPIANHTTAARPAGAPALPTRDFVVMLQGLDRDALRLHTQALVQALAPVATAVSSPAFFELLSQVRQDKLNHPLSSRQPARLDLFKTFQTGDIT